MTAPDPVLLRVYQNLLDSVAEEMGSALERTGFSPNIKERRDYSCAAFDAAGEMVAQAAHNPVHLGSTPLSVAAAIEAHDFAPGDAILLNDPYRGGTHLPDLTLVSAVFEPDREAPTYYVANRAHHADVGGMSPGSMALFREIYQEGVRIPPVLLRRRGVPVTEVETLLFANMRHAAERRGDLRAQLVANEVGERGLRRLLAEQDRDELLAYGEHLKDAGERHVRALLARIPDGRYSAHEWLEDDGVCDRRIELCVAATIEGEHAHFDFTGTSPQVGGCLNTIPAVVLSAVFYVLRTLAGAEIPSNAGCLRPVRLTLPAGSLLDPHPPAAVAGGNVETSQRLVDLLFLALADALPGEVPAQSQGTMNNFTLGHSVPGGAEATYYETIAGGGGATAAGAGASGRHSHMTNTRNTPIEVLEHVLPVRVEEYSLRRGSGGAGRHSGGEGLVREIRALEPMHAALITERRALAPAGAAGGGSARPGKNERRSGDRLETLPAKWSGELASGESLRITTPGGAGWGAA